MDHPGNAPRLVAVEDADALAEEAGALVMGAIQDAVRLRGAAHVVLAGGGTPRKTHARLARLFAERGVARGAVSWWFGDERWVAASDPQSNEGMARETLLGPLGVPEETIHSWAAGTGEPVERARRYGDALAAAVPGRAADVVMLGIGPDGHTASLFPGSTIFLPDGRQQAVGPRLPGGFAAAAVHGGNAPGWRLTLTPEVLSSARTVLFLVAGADKAGPLRRAVDGDPSTPAAWIRGAATMYLATRDAVGRADTGYGYDIQRA